MNEIEEKEFRDRLRQEVKRITEGDMSDIVNDKSSIDNSNIEEPLLSRIDFGILVSITASIFSIWYFLGSNRLFGDIFAGTYMLMGAYLSYHKGRYIVRIGRESSPNMQYTAWVFFNTWPFVVIYSLIVNLAYEITPYSLAPWRLYIVFFFCFIIWKRRSFAIGRVWNDIITGAETTTAVSIRILSKWMFVYVIFDTLLSFTISINTDKQFYEYTDNVYISVSSPNTYMGIVGFVDSKFNIISTTEIKDNLYSFPASVAYNQDVYAVKALRYKQFGDDNTILKNAKRNMRVKLDINVKSLDTDNYND